MEYPKTLIEAIKYFSDHETCIAYMASLRWPDGAICPNCGRMDASYLKSQQRFQCKSRHPKRQFSVKIGTIFEDSPLGLDKWLPAVWMIVNAKNGVSSYEIARSLGVTQKTAWFMDHRIRAAMSYGSFDKLVGPVEADETYSELTFATTTLEKLQNSTKPTDKIWSKVDPDGDDEKVSLKNLYS